MDWAFAHHVDAGEDGIVIFPGIFGSPIDPSTPMHDRDVSRLGTGLERRADRRDPLVEDGAPRRAGRGALSAHRAARTEDKAPGREAWDEYGLGDH